MPKPVSKLPRTEVTPEPALEKRTRRRFSAAYKLRIVREADRCQRGELSGLLRREHLYSSQLQQWRRELAENGTVGLNKSSPGASTEKTAEQGRIGGRGKENLRRNRKLGMAQDCLELQKKEWSMLDRSKSGSDA